MSIYSGGFWRVRILVAVATIVALGQMERPVAQRGNAAVCDISTSERVVSVGDVHGAHDRFVSILREANIIDRRDRWSGGRAILVQTGDVLDRGADSRKTLDLLRRLERDATRAGGRVYALLGNHEVMRMVGDWRYVSAGEFAAFRTPTSADARDRVFAVLEKDEQERARAESRLYDAAIFRERFLRDVPLGLLELREAFAADGEYGRWLRSHPAMVKINGVLYVHGGVSLDVAALGCAGINAAVAEDLTVAAPSPARAAEMLSMRDRGPLWYRGLAEEPEAAFAPTLDDILRALAARAIVIGHTVTRDFHIASRFGGKVIQTDTGMLGGDYYPGGRASALQIHGGTLTAIYQGRPREQVPAPALEGAAIPAAR